MKKFNMVLVAFMAGVAVAMTACGNKNKKSKKTDAPANVTGSPVADATKTPDGGTDGNQDLEIPSSSFVMAGETGGEISISIVRLGENENSFAEKKYKGDLGLLTLSSAPYAPIPSRSLTVIEDAAEPGLPLKVDYYHLAKSNEQLVLATYFDEGAAGDGDVYVFGRKMGSNESFRLVSDHLLIQELQQSTGMTKPQLRDRLQEYLSNTGLSHIGNFKNSLSAHGLPSDF